MKTQLTLLAALLVLTLTGCQVEGLSSEQGASAPSSASEPSTATNTDPHNSGSSADNSNVNDYDGVMLYWSAPRTRMNGIVVGMDDIQGYEIRYKKDTDEDYTSILILDAYTDQLPIDGIDDASEYKFEVAAIDKFGIYSRFVTASHI